MIYLRYPYIYLWDSWKSSLDFWSKYGQEDLVSAFFICSLKFDTVRLAPRLGCLYCLGIYKSMVYAQLNMLHSLAWMQGQWAIKGHTDNFHLGSLKPRFLLHIGDNSFLNEKPCCAMQQAPWRAAPGNYSASVTYMQFHPRSTAFYIWIKWYVEWVQRSLVRTFNDSSQYNWRLALWYFILCL